MKKEIDQAPEKIFSVSEFINLLNIGLKRSKAKIVGEVNEVNFGPTGNVYFYLKDKKDQSVLKCMAYKERYGLYGINLEKGMKIIIEGYPNLHKIYSFAFIAEVIEYSGEGELKKEYERLKEKLTREGLFEEKRKRLLPLYPQKIGVITSLKGAVMADFSNNLEQFGFKVKIVDSRVEGQASIPDLLSAIKTLKKQDIEILVLMRGGGSLESMAAFNNELLVREAVNFPVPIIAAIGHDKDITLFSLAADLAVSTPSIAATKLNESWKQALLFLQKDKIKILDNYRQILNNAKNLTKETAQAVRFYTYSLFEKHKENENKLKIFLRDFKNNLKSIKIDLNGLAKKYFFDFKLMLSRIEETLEYAEKLISLNDPKRQLFLGFSIARYKGKIIKSVKNIKKGESLSVQFSDGKVNSIIKEIKNNF